MVCVLDHKRICTQLIYTIKNTTLSYPEFSPPAEGEEVIIGLKTDGSRPKLLLKMLEEENEEVLTTGPPPPPL